MLTFRRVVRDTVKEIGYDDALKGFDSNTCAVISTINRQSPDIAQGVDTGGAGDQGMMFGYAIERDAGADADTDFAGAQAGAEADRGS